MENIENNKTVTTIKTKDFNYIINIKHNKTFNIANWLKRNIIRKYEIIKTKYPVQHIFYDIIDDNIYYLNLSNVYTLEMETIKE